MDLEDCLLANLESLKGVEEDTFSIPILPEGLWERLGLCDGQLQILVFIFHVGISASLTEELSLPLPVIACPQPSSEH